MNEQKHTIGRHILELTVNDREHALSIQNNASNLVKNKLIPALDQLFSRLTTKEEVLRIDHLVLDLGDISSTSFDEEMVKKTIDNLESRLSRIIYEQKSKRPDSSGSGIDEQTKTVYITKPESHFEQLIYYLKFGVLPWWREEKEKLMLSKLVEMVAREQKEKTIEFALPLLLFEQVKRRIAYQLNDSEFLEFVTLMPSPIRKKITQLHKTLDPGKLSLGWEAAALIRFHLLDIISEGKEPGHEVLFIELIERLTHDILKVKSKTEQETVISAFIMHFNKLPLDNELKEKVFRFIVQIAKEKKIDFKTSDIQLPGKLLEKKEIIPFKTKKEKSLREMKEEEKIFPETVKESIEEIDKTAEQEDKIKQEKTDRLEGVEGTDDNEDAGSIENISKSEEEIRKTEDSSKEIKLPGPRPKKEEAERERDEKRFRLNVDEMEVYVNNAGLVLLHPFLFYFFDGLGLLNEDKVFNSIEDAFRAVHLLQYLATGETASPEHELSLNKVLCGIDLNDSIPFEVQLTKEEKEESLNLLTVVLERWEALKTKEPEALRDGFLKREGRLSFKGNGWNLYIERATLDIMLDRLPWSISMIKLPWRDDLIYVEW